MAIQNSGQNNVKKHGFQKGQSGNPGGRPKLPEEFKNFAKQAPERLREIADDKKTPVKVKADIEKWFAEMYYGKAGQQMFIDGNLDTTGTMKVEFGETLKEWSE